MQLQDYISTENLIRSLASSGKEDAIREMAAFLSDKGKLADVNATVSALLDREKLGSTGVGEEVAIPHAKLADIEDIVILVAMKEEGIDFESVDDAPVKLFFLVLAPEKQMNLHLKTLARISRLIKMSQFKERALSAENAEEIIDILKEEESKL